MLDGSCEACEITVPAGRGWVLPRPECLAGPTPHVLLCRSDALATAPVDGLDGRVAALLADPPLVGDVPYVFSDYQDRGARFLAERWRALLTDDKGLGKTAQALLAVPEGAPVVIVCPAQVKTVWLREFQIWRPGYSVVILEGRRSWSPPPPGSASVLNYEILPAAPIDCGCGHPEPEHGAKGCRGCGCRRFRGRLPAAAEVRELLGLAEGTVLIADEAHKAKGASSTRTRRLRYLVRGCARSWGLTASPMMNHHRELWCLYGVFGLSRAAFGTRANFNRLYRNYDDWGTAPDATDAAAIQDRRARVELGRSAEDVGLELPELRFETRTVVLDADARREVDQALRRVIAARKAWRELKDGKITKAELPERRRLLELTSHTDAEVLELVERVIVTREWGAIAAEISALRRALACAKIPGALRYAQECADAGEPLVAFSAHVLPAETLGGLPGWGCMRNPRERTELVDRFQAGELAGIAGTIRCAEGITLHRARLVLLVDQDWTPEANDQAIKRIHRRGQHRACLVTTLIADHPLDQHVNRVLARKTALIQATTRRTVR